MEDISFGIMDEERKEKENELSSNRESFYSAEDKFFSEESLN